MLHVKETCRWVVYRWVSPYKARVGVKGLHDVYKGLLEGYSSDNYPHEGFLAILIT